MASADNALTIGVDLGGTKVEAALVDRDGGIVSVGRRATNAAKGAEGVVADLVASITEGCLPAADRPVLGVGIGVAGQVDPATGTVLHAPNLQWDDFPLKAQAANALGLPVSVLNDVQAATYGEWRYGCAQGVTDVVCIFVGTGIGGGVIANGHLVVGCGGSAGELGHMIVDRRGNPGTLEAQAGGLAIARRAREAVANDPVRGESLLRRVDGDGHQVTARTVAEAAHAGDPLAMELMRETGEALAAGLITVVNAFNPCLLILGGGVIDGSPELIDVVREELERGALKSAVKSLRITRPGLGPHAGAIGAAAWARHNLETTEGGS